MNVNSAKSFRPVNISKLESTFLRALEYRLVCSLAIRQDKIKFTTETFLRSLNMFYRNVYSIFKRLNAACTWNLLNFSYSFLISDTYSVRKSNFSDHYYNLRRVFRLRMVALQQFKFFLSLNNFLLISRVSHLNLMNQLVL